MSDPFNMVVGERVFLFCLVFCFPKLCAGALPGQS